MYLLVLITLAKHVFASVTDNREAPLSSDFALSMNEPVRYRTYQIQNLSDTEPIKYRTYHTPNLSVPNLSDNQPITYKEVSPSPFKSLDDRQPLQHRHPSPLSPSQLTMTANPSSA